MSTNLNVSETRYREQDRIEFNKTLQNNVTMYFRPGFIVSGVLFDQRNNNRTVSFTGDLQNYVKNKQEFTGSIEYMKQLTDEIHFSTWSRTFVTKDQLNFLVDKSVKGNVATGMIYKKGSRFKVTGRGFLSNSTGRADGGTQHFTGLSARQDSLQSTFKLQVTDSADVRFEYTRFDSERSYADLPRGVFQEQDLGGKEIVRERELRNSRQMAVRTTMYPVRGLKMDVEGVHKEQIIDYQREERRSSETVTDYVKADLEYTMGSNTFATVMIEDAKITHNLGTAVSNNDEKQQNFKFSLRHSFSSITTWNVQALASLRQVYYERFTTTTPRDWDQLKQSVNSSIRSKLFDKLDVNIMLSATALDVIYIHTSLSSDNRKETTYDLRPMFTYHLSDRTQIRQEYALNIEFTDYVFTEEENFLDRNIKFNNSITSQLTDKIDVEFHYRLHLHDGGSYLRDNPEAERLLIIDTEDRKDEAELKCKYSINERLTAICEQKYSLRTDKIVGTQIETRFEDGEVKGGLLGKFNWGTGRSLSFTMVRVKRFGNFNTDTQNDFWELDARMNYAF